MKHLKEFKLFESKSIDYICKEYGIQNYTINPDGTVDVDGNVNLSFKELEKLPLKFGKVSGTFYCHFNQLNTLEGCPHTVGGDFRCHNNQLTSLEGCPRTVGDNFFCDNNQLTSLEGCPRSVGRDFFCYNNKLNTLEGLTDVFIIGRFEYGHNPLHKLVGGWLINSEFPDMDRIELFNDVGVIIGNKLYLSKLEYFHDVIGVDLPDMEEVRKYYEVIE